MMDGPLCIGGVEVPPGQRLAIDLPLGRLYTHTELTMPVYVVHGRKRGPRLFVSAAIHGDEINGIEIIHRLLRMEALRRLSGALIAVPVVNVLGFINHTRYLPDRRDLNRFFPGSERGSLTSRLAHLFMTQIVNHSTHGIDLHTGSHQRENLPQVRGSLDHPETRRLALAFGAPIVLHSDLRDGSLRQTVAERGMPMLVYEAGEAMRFHEESIRVGVRGVLHVMRWLNMLPPTVTPARHPGRPLVAHVSTWLRAPQSGILRAPAALGERVRRNQVLGAVANPFGEEEVQVTAPVGGVIVGRTNVPLVNEGDALFHIALTREPGRGELATPPMIEPDPDLARSDQQQMAKI